VTSVDIMVHEVSHEWFGNDVTIQRWSDICINECFGSYAPWLWKAHVDDADLNAMWERQMRRVVDDPDFWSSPLVDMGPGREFTSVYDRGPLAVHALRNEMGEDAFLTLLRQWPATYTGKSASFNDLQAMASTLAGRDLGPFMDAWFRGKTAPDIDFRYPGDLGD
jgi:aminopeptidase N